MIEAREEHTGLPRGGRWALAIILGLTALPLLWPAIPPLIDLPNHMSRFAIGAAYDTSPYFRQWFDFHWALVGNLGVDIPATFLARWIGVEPATKLIILTIPLLTVAAMTWLSRGIHRALSPTLPVAAMFAYNYPLNYGFVNFVMSAALALLAFALWVFLDQQGRRGLRAILFVPVALLVWLAHAVGWGMLGLIVFGYEFAVRHRPPVRAVTAAYRAAVSCLVLCLPLVPMVAWYLASMQQSPTAMNYQIFRKIAYFLFALRDYNPIVDVGSLACVLGAIAIGLLSRDFRIDRRLLYPAILLGIVYLIMPDALLGSGYTDLRLIPYGIMLCVLAIAPVRRSRLVTLFTCAAWVLFVARAVYVTVTYVWLSNNYERELAALSVVPVGSTVFGFERVTCLRDWHDDRFDHLHRIATVRRQAFTNSTWPPVASQTLFVRPYMIRDYHDVDSQRFVPERCRVFSFQSIDGSVAQLPRSPFDYYWLIGAAPSAWPRRDWLKPVWSNADSVLYKINRRAALAAARPGGASPTAALGHDR